MIRRALAALALLFAPAAYASVTLTVSPTGAVTPTGAYVRMDIANCTNPTVVNSNTKIPVSRQFRLNNAASVTLTVEDNVTQIACNGNQLSYYTVTYVANGVQTQLKSVELPPGIFAFENLAAVYAPPWNPGIIQGPPGTPGQGDPGTVTATGVNGAFNVPGTLRVGPNQQILNALDRPAMTGSPTLANITTNNVGVNSTQRFYDGSKFFTAAPGYTFMYVSDTSLAMLGSPADFTENDVRNTIQKFIAARSTSANAPLPVGSIPVAIDTNGNADNGVNPYCAGFDGWCHFPTAEGPLSLVHLEAELYRRTADLTQFNADAAILDTAMGTIRLDGTTSIPVSPTGAEYVCYGFQESIRFTGLLGTCAMQYWKAATELGQLYSAAGNATLAAKYVGYAANIAANLGTAGPLWDATDGMFYGATIQDRQIDTTASALFCQYKIPSPNAAAQCTAISNYIVAHVSTLTFSGFIRQSNVDFVTVGGLTTGTTPYNPVDYRTGAGCYQRGGYWSHFNRAVIETMLLTSVPAARAYATSFQNSVDPTVELWSPLCAGALHGFGQNLESPVGTLYGISESPSIAVPSQTGHDVVIGGGYAFPTGLSALGPYVQITGVHGEVPSIILNRADNTTQSSMSFLTDAHDAINLNRGFTMGLLPVGAAPEAFQIMDRSTGNTRFSIAPGQSPLFPSGLVSNGPAVIFPSAAAVGYDPATGAIYGSNGPNTTTPGAINLRGTSSNDSVSQNYLACATVTGVCAFTEPVTAPVVKPANGLSGFVTAVGQFCSGILISASATTCP